MSKTEEPQFKKLSGLRLRIFAPILAGATLRERLFACLGSLVAISATGWICTLILGDSTHLPFLVAPVGASAVLLFAVPTSPLAQPWPIIGGNTLSALVGVIVAQVVHDPLLAIGLAVALAIAVMSFTRCLHPPGGAAALTSVLGGPSIAAAGFLYPFVPVALNSVLLVALGFLFHKMSKRAYPHRPARSPDNAHGTSDLPPHRRIGFRSEDVDAALEALDETFDIDRNDLDTLLRQVETEALVRYHATLRCEDIMSRDVITVDRSATLAEARALLLEHNVRTLPVVDEKGLVGTVGLRETATFATSVGEVMSRAATISPGDPAVRLVPILTDGRTHAVVVTGSDRKILGLITQTDLLAAMAH